MREQDEEEEEDSVGVCIGVGIDDETNVVVETSFIVAAGGLLLVFVLHAFKNRRMRKTEARLRVVSWRLSIAPFRSR